MIITGLIHNLETECHEKINYFTFILFVFIKMCKKKGRRKKRRGKRKKSFILENVCINA